VADHFQDQKLGMQGASTLADVLKVNKTLQYLYCENNGIALTGHTDLINALPPTPLFTQAKSKAQPHMHMNNQHTLVPPISAPLAASHAA
jgi:hypothetical protein